MKDITAKIWLSLCSEALLYLLNETDVFYHMPALPEDFSILKNMQPFCSLKQEKESERKKKFESSPHHEICQHQKARLVQKPT